MVKSLGEAPGYVAEPLHFRRPAAVITHGDIISYRAYDKNSMVLSLQVAELLSFASYGDFQHLCERLLLGMMKTETFVPNDMHVAGVPANK